MRLNSLTYLPCTGGSLYPSTLFRNLLRTAHRARTVRFEISNFGYFRSMSDSRKNKPATVAASPKTKGSSRPGKNIDAELEDAVEELAATFGAGPKAAPQPEGPMEGQQLAP